MRIIGKEEIEALIRMTPDTPANGPLLDALTQLYNQTRIVRFPYTYSATFTTLGVAATATVNVPIDAAAPFLIVNQTFRSDIAGAAVSFSGANYPNATVLLTESGSNRQMMDVAVPITSIFGNGQFPYVLPEPKLLAANSNLVAQVTSQEAANTPTIRLSFNGYKLYSL